MSPPKGHLNSSQNIGHLQTCQGQLGSISLAQMYLSPLLFAVMRPAWHCYDLSIQHLTSPKHKLTASSGS